MARPVSSSKLPSVDRVLCECEVPSGHCPLHLRCRKVELPRKRKKSECLQVPAIASSFCSVSAVNIMFHKCFETVGCYVGHFQTTGPMVMIGPKILKSNK